MTVATGSILRRINLAEFATSSKIEALTRELVMMRQSSPGSKAIVFSQFVNMLDLIRWRLHSDPYLEDIGLGCRALHGGMNVKARDDCLREFREDNNVRVLLMSLKAGGVALNLTWWVIFQQCLKQYQKFRRWFHILIIDFLDYWTSFIVQIIYFWWIHGGIRQQRCKLFEQMHYDHLRISLSNCFPLWANLSSQASYRPNSSPWPVPADPSCSIHCGEHSWRAHSSASGKEAIGVWRHSRKGCRKFDDALSRWHEKSL